METFSKKIILWLSVAGAMAVVIFIWVMSWKNYNFSQSTKQIEEFKEEVQDKLQEIEMPAMPDLKASVGAIHELPLEE